MYYPIRLVDTINYQHNDSIIDENSQVYVKKWNF